MARAPRPPINYAPHTLVQFGGAISLNDFPGEEPEIWACGVRVVAATGSGPIGPVAGYLESVAVNLAAWFADPVNTMASNSTLKWVKANAIGQNGKYLDRNNPHTHNYAVDIVGRQPAVHPPVISVCLSWVTARKVGRSSHGRIYPPNWTLGTGSSLSIEAVLQDAAVVSGKNLLTALTGVPGSFPAIPVVASSVDASFEPITGVRVGNILDIQRRRKDAIRERYRGQAWP